MGPLPPNIMCYLFNSLIRPILLYGSDIWGINKAGKETIDKVFLRYMRCVLGVKCTTSNIITIGECGEMPPSVYADINTLCYAERLKNIPDTAIVKQVYLELKQLNENGFKTWVTAVQQTANSYGINKSFSSESAFKKYCKDLVFTEYKKRWKSDLTNTEQNPVLRTYVLFKKEIKLEKYLTAVNNPLYRKAICKLRASSHILEIERGRYNKPKTRVSERLCQLCKAVEDE